MAQIVTITNPLTGQPAQVDQLEHTAQQIDDAIARALPGGAIDVALQNKAPAGYGLGTTGASINSGKDLNDIWQCGFYSWGSGVSNAPFGYGLMVVLSPGDYADGRVQIAYDRVNKTIAIRWLNTTWSPWEYQNPPMQLGVEYRTTERYLGKPVYTKTIDCGAGPNKTSKYVYFDSTTPNIDRVISVEGSNSDGGAFPYERKDNSDYLSSAKDYILIESTYDRSNITVYATIKYTKTTD